MSNFIDIKCSLYTKHLFLFDLTSHININIKSSLKIECENFWGQNFWWKLWKMFREIVKKNVWKLKITKIDLFLSGSIFPRWVNFEIFSAEYFSGNKEAYFKGILKSVCLVYYVVPVYRIVPCNKGAYTKECFPRVAAICLAVEIRLFVVLSYKNSQQKTCQYRKFGNFSSLNNMQAQ